MINTKAVNEFQKVWKLNCQPPVCSNITQTMLALRCPIAVLHRVDIVLIH